MDEPSAALNGGVWLVNLMAAIVSRIHRGMFIEVRGIGIP